MLVHNIFHEKQHTGQVWNIRDELRLVQGWGDASLYPPSMRSAADADDQCTQGRVRTQDA